MLATPIPQYVDARHLCRMEDKTQYIFALLGLLASLYFIYWKADPLYNIPAIGPSAPILSYLGAYRYYYHGRQVLREGYRKYKVFRVPMLDRWVVVVSGADMNEELRKLPDTHVSLAQAVNEFIHSKYTVARDITDHPIHTAVIRGPLTRNLNLLFPDVVDEMKTAFPEVMPLPTHDGEWVAISVRNTMACIVSRASNRVFVGLPLCRDPKFLDTLVEYALSVSKARDILNVMPGRVRGIVGNVLPWVKRATRHASVCIQPMVQERLQRLQNTDDDHGDKPHDYLTWLIEETQKVKLSPDFVVQGILASNFSAVHTASNSITHALFNLAAHTQYMQPLREEVEDIIKEHGWTYNAIKEMWKLDSFMRESQRLCGVTGVSLMRKVLLDITLSDGTYIPKGTLVVAASSATHTDKTYYENAEAFVPFRFYDMCTENGTLGTQFVNTSKDYLAFGHGKHACPGRFFVAHELKAMMAYIILHYDVKLEDGALWVWHDIPPPSAKILFRKRQSEVE
ncbi:hypothetical protein POSPLADRAFT_1130463 [Postia placenta MAD-698-R-SB12]|uniref:Cytochrome P450 n=2 Tax=Rhodonia placenta TaxID=104341 RepID=A0A1X6NEY0_9APHY|nr:hypothetical protein POSPLADRAFT_1130463 [Postia placenta MAD-698-R-SB12]OSX67199.1 hypothetical protein POSPLADRAFT_1130463 [Postia placenta MAD-698-R-SB12]BAK09374.1 cytochrome P450 [Postia placenta]